MLFILHIVAACISFVEICFVVCLAVSSVSDLLIPCYVLLVTHWVCPVCI
jgi:hypothetical protein